MYLDCTGTYLVCIGTYLECIGTYLVCTGLNLVCMQLTQVSFRFMPAIPANMAALAAFLPGMGGRLLCFTGFYVLRLGCTSGWE